MNKDLKWIKKHFGEKMMHLCRALFPRILEQEGLLPSILDKKFQRNRSLADEIINQEKIVEFKNFIYSFVDVEANYDLVIDKSPEELLDEAGYVLFPECTTEEDLEAFTKYYAPGEKLCTFWTDRLKDCRVWFAVKKNVDQIRRSDFINPTRQDEYGTSVISIQFTKGPSCTLSIKNRYNHSVNNPDNTFNSDLDNIIPGLTSAFYSAYGVKDMYAKRRAFELDGYTQVNGVYFKYNYEINGVYYCPGNVIIKNYQVERLEDHQMLIDYFVFDFKNKTVKIYDKRIIDCFADTISDIKDMFYDNGLITIETQNGEIIEIVEKDRKIVSIKHDDLTKCGESFLFYNDSLEYLSMENLTECGEGFLFKNEILKQLNMPKLKRCGESFLRSNNEMIEISLPSLEECEGMFLVGNENLEEVYLPRLVKCGACFMYSNKALTELFLPSIKECGDYILMCNKKLKSLYAPNLDEASRRLLRLNHRMLVEQSENEQE